MAKQRKKLSKQAMRQKRIAKLKQPPGKVSEILREAAMSPLEREMYEVGKEVQVNNAHPDINPKRVGCRYGGWARISVCNRPGRQVERIRAMHFFGDWCPSEKFDEILPDEVKDDKTRTYYIDFFMFDITGAEYDIPTQIVRNPKNMTDLQLRARDALQAVTMTEGFLFDFDKSYAEIRA